MLDTAVRNNGPPEADRLKADFTRITKRKDYLARVFASSNHPSNHRRASRLSNCRRARLVFCDDAGEALLVPYTCSLRVCPECSRQKSTDRWLRVMGALARKATLIGLDLRWITLTIKNPDWGSLEPAVAGLLKAFRRLRRSPAWDLPVTGCIWNFEVTLNRKARSWHPHIHVIYDGSHWPWQSLKKTWKNFLAARSMVGNANLGVIYVGPKTQKQRPRTHHDLTKAIGEVTKYTLKPFEAKDTPAACIIELVSALHGKRAWGSAGSLDIPPTPKAIDARWHMLSGLGKILEDRDSCFWTDPAFNQALISRLSAIEGMDQMHLLDAYPLLDFILNADHPTMADENT